MAWAAQSVVASTLYVDAAGTNPVPPYASWETAAVTIQAAVDAASAADTVLVTNGVFGAGLRLSPDGGYARVVVPSNITVRSVNGPRFTTIAGGTVSGGVRCAYLATGSSLSGFTLTNGITTLWGGGAACASVGASLSNCVISGSTAAIGGGAYGGTLVNCVVAGNSASVGAGTADCAQWHCTVVGNKARTASGGCSGGVLYNSIVYFNLAPTSTQYSGSTFSNSCTVPLPPGTGNFTNPPLLAAIDNPWLLSGSPCIDRGSNAFARSVLDLDGLSRTNGPAVDLGALEFDATLSTGGLDLVIVLPAGSVFGPGAPIPFRASVMGRPSGLLWQFDDVTELADAAQCEHAFSTLGVHAVRLLASNLESQVAVTAAVTVVSSADPLVWSGGLNGVWDLGQNACWGGDRFVFTNGANVRLDDTSIQRTVTRVGILEPASVTVDTTNTYRIETGGSFSGSMHLVKSGTGTLYLGSSDTFTGDVFIRQGSVHLAGQSAGNAQIGETYVSNGATLYFGATFYLPLTESVHLVGSGRNGQGALNYEGGAALYGVERITLDDDARIHGEERFDMRGTGTVLNLNGHTLEKTGAGQFSLIGSTVTNAGSIVVSNGTLSLEDRAVVSGPGSILFKTNTTLLYWLGSHVSKPILLDGGGIYSYGVPCTASAPHVVLSSCRIDAGSPIWFTNTLSGAGSFLKSGVANVYLCASNSFTGAFRVAGGLVDLVVAGAEGMLITNDAILRFSATNSIDLNAGFALGGRGLTVFDTPAGATAGTGVVFRSTGVLHVARGAPARFTIGTGADLTVRQCLIGSASGSSGLVVQSGGVLRTLCDLRVGAELGTTSRYELVAGSLLATNISAFPPFTPTSAWTSSALCVGLMVAGSSSCVAASPVSRAS